MSLDWDITDCNLDKEWQKENWLDIKDMIFMTMTVDIGHIKQDNLDKFEYRLRIMARILNLYDSTDIDRLIAILPKLVGMRTNVITTTEAQFHKKVIDNLKHDTEYQMKMALKQKEKEEANANS